LVRILNQWNDIYGNGIYNFYNGDNDIDAKYIYWGSTDSAQIAATIYDFYEDPSKGKVFFNPWTNAQHDSLFPYTANLDLKIFHEGPFNGTNMNTDLNPDNIPLSQPYNVAPWNYTGDESVVTLPNNDIVDWVLIEFRDAPDAGSATGATMIGRLAAFVLYDGSVVDIDGSSHLSLISNISEQLFVVVWHRNHLGVMSANPLTEAGGVYSYDFTITAGQAYGTDAQKDLGGGVFGMYAGDSNADRTIDDSDKTGDWMTETGTFGYLPSDANLDGQSNNLDKNDFWLPNVGESCQVPGAIPFNCGDPLVDSRDGQSYNTVQIGTQCWMAENLNIGTVIDGIDEQTDNGTIEKYCHYDNISHCDTYGGLYQWNEMMQYTTTPGVQGICPPAWHIPADEEWKQLEGEVDGLYGYPDPEWDQAGMRGSDAGLNLRSTSGWYSGNGIDLYGFTALPGGHRNDEGSFEYLTFGGYFWTSDHSNSALSWYRELYYAFYYEIGRYDRDKLYGLSVRCLKD